MRTRLLNIFLVLIITLSAAYAQADIASDIQAGDLSLQEVVEKALDEELSAAEIVTQLIAAGVNPVLAAEFVAIAKPSAAAEIAKAAAIAAPYAAVDIAGTVAKVVPEAAADIAAAVAQVVPKAAADIAATVAQAVPEAAADIAGAVAQVVPETTTEPASSVTQVGSQGAMVGGSLLDFERSNCIPTKYRWKKLGYKNIRIDKDRLYRDLYCFSRFVVALYFADFHISQQVKQQQQCVDKSNSFSLSLYFDWDDVGTPVFYGQKKQTLIPGTITTRAQPCRLPKICEGTPPCICPPDQSPDGKGGCM